MLIANDDVVNGNPVKKFYLAKGLRFENEVDANGQPLKLENSFKMIYKPNTGVGAIVRLSETQMLNFSNGGAWNHLNGKETINVKYEVSPVQQATVPTGFKEGDETFVTNVVEILLETKSTSQGAVRPKGDKTAKTVTTNSANAISEEIEMEDADDDQWDDQE